MRILWSTFSTASLTPPGYGIFFSNIFQQTDRDRGSITNTLNKWRRSISGNKDPNLAWAFTPRFIIWNVWKERNNRIFKSEKANPHKLYDFILKQIRETDNTTMHNIPENALSKEELRALKLLESQGITPQGIGKKDTVMNIEKDFWHPPLKNYLKFNIDGASKGNPRKASFGGVLRNEEGRLILIFHSHLGKAINNMVELMALEQCLEIMLQIRSPNVIIEADSEITINSIKRISCGSKPEKVSNGN